MVDKQDGFAVPEDDVGETAAPLSPEEIWDRNALLRKQYVAVCAQLQAARESGDMEQLRAAEAARENVADAFVRINRGLVSSNARKYLKGVNREDHEAAALMGLWEAFVGTQVSEANKVEVDEDGSVHALSGWDPDSATFGTWSRSHISGKASRSVVALDEKFHGVSYSTFQLLPEVAKATAELRAELGREPTVRQIAARAKVTAETVENAQAASPMSLSTPVFDDDSSSLGDVLADQLPGSDSDEFYIPSLTLVADQLSVVDLLVASMRFGLTGRPRLTVNRTADALGIGRGVVNNAHRRVTKAVSAYLESKGVDPATAGELTLLD